MYLPDCVKISWKEKHICQDPSCDYMAASTIDKVQSPTCHEYLEARSFYPLFTDVYQKHTTT